jgi:hypothetical protein
VHENVDIRMRNRTIEAHPSEPDADLTAISACRCTKIRPGDISDCRYSHSELTENSDDAAVCAEGICADPVRDETLPIGSKLRVPM